MTTPPFITKVPPVLVVTLLKAELLPTAACSVVIPVLFKVRLCIPLVASFTVPPSVMSPLPELMVVSAVSESAVSLSPKLMTLLVVFTVPAALMAAGFVAVTPPAKVKVSPAPLPSTKLPVFKNVVAVFAALTLVVVPNNSTL